MYIVFPVTGEVAAWINEGRIWGFHCEFIFDLRWVKAMGAEKVLNIQAAIVLAAAGIIAVLQFFGRNLRLERANIHIYFPVVHGRQVAAGTVDFWWTPRQET